MEVATPRFLIIGFDYFDSSKNTLVKYIPGNMIS
jgi:hypothetical protein